MLSYLLHTVTGPISATHQWMIVVLILFILPLNLISNSTIQNGLSGVHFRVSAHHVNIQLLIFLRCII